MQRNAFIVVVALLALGVGLLVWRSGPSTESEATRSTSGTAGGGESGGDRPEELAPRPAGGGSASNPLAERRQGQGSETGSEPSRPKPGTGERDADSGAAAVRDRLAHARRVGSTTGTGLPEEGNQVDVAVNEPPAEPQPEVKPASTPQAASDTTTTTTEEPEAQPVAVDEVAYDSGTDKLFSTETQVELPDVGKITGAAGTMSFWVKPDWESGNTNDAMFLQMGDSGLHINKNVTYLRFEYYDTQGAEQGVGTYIGDWKPGEWYQVTGTWVGNQYALYINDKLVTQNTFTHPPDFQDDTRVYAGSNYSTGEVAPGDISHIKVLNRPMTAVEIKDLFEARDRPR